MEAFLAEISLLINIYSVLAIYVFRHYRIIGNTQNLALSIQFSSYYVNIYSVLLFLQQKVPKMHLHRALLKPTSYSSCLVRLLSKASTSRALACTVTISSSNRFVDVSDFIFTLICWKFVLISNTLVSGTNFDFVFDSCFL